MTQLSWAMTKSFTDVLRAAIAIQVAVYELAEEDVSENLAASALNECTHELVNAVKRLIKEVT